MLTLTEVRIAPLTLLVLCLLPGCPPEPTLGHFCVHTTDCGSPLVCRLGRCRSECSQNRDCPADQRCLLDTSGLGACSLAFDACIAATVCPPGLTCLEASCSNACTSVAQCPPDAICAPTTDGMSRCASTSAPDAGSDATP